MTTLFCPRVRNQRHSSGEGKTCAVDQLTQRLYYIWFTPLGIYSQQTTTWNYYYATHARVWYITFTQLHRRRPCMAYDCGTIVASRSIDTICCSGVEYWVTLSKDMLHLRWPYQRICSTCVDLIKGYAPLALTLSKDMLHLRWPYQRICSTCVDLIKGYAPLALTLSKDMLHLRWPYQRICSTCVDLIKGYAPLALTLSKDMLHLRSSSKRCFGVWEIGQQLRRMVRGVGRSNHTSYSVRKLQSLSRKTENFRVEIHYGAWMSQCSGIREAMFE